jgi:hypothetical protein
MTTHNTHNKHPCSRWDSNPQSQQASGLDLRLRPRGHWDRQLKECINNKYLNYAAFKLQLKCHIYNTCSKFNDVGFLLFIKSQFTKNPQSLLHLYQFTPWTRLSWTVAAFLRPRAVANGLTVIKISLIRCLFIFSWN